MPHILYDLGSDSCSVLDLVVRVAIQRGHDHCLAVLDRRDGDGCLQILISGSLLPVAVVVLYQFRGIRGSFQHLF